LKKALALLLTATLACGALLSGCSSSSTGSNGEVNVYNWGVYIDESVIDEFEAQTGIKVNYDTFDSNESMYGVLKNEGASYDVIIPSDYMISRMIEEDMLEPLNFDNIPNFSDIDPALKNPDYDPENLYSVPYMWGLLGIIYNTTMVSEAPTSWATMFDSQYNGQILMFNNSRDGMGVALKYLGYSYNTTDKAQIQEATDLLIQQKPLVQSYVMDEIVEKMQGGVAAIGAYYYGDYLTMAEVNPDLAFCLPEEGTNLYVDAMCIPKTAENKESAEAFINFMCSTDVGLRNCEEICYSTPLLSVREALDEEIANDPFAYPDETILANCESFKNLPEDILAFYDSEWTRLMLASDK
jgi:spermidine/putrescine transport system substrate-binding protein